MLPIGECVVFLCRNGNSVTLATVLMSTVRTSPCYPLVSVLSFSVEMATVTLATVFVSTVRTSPCYPLVSVLSFSRNGSRVTSVSVLSTVRVSPSCLSL